MPAAADRLRYQRGTTCVDPEDRRPHCGECGNPCATAGGCLPPYARARVLRLRRRDGAATSSAGLPPTATTTSAGPVLRRTAARSKHPNRSQQLRRLRDPVQGRRRVRRRGLRATSAPFRARASARVLCPSRECVDLLNDPTSSAARAATSASAGPNQLARVRQGRSAPTTAHAASPTATATPRTAARRTCWPIPATAGAQRQRV